MTNLQIELPKPQSTGKITVEEAIARRRSARDFEQKPIKLEHISQILWAAQGITESPLYIQPIGVPK